MGGGCAVAALEAAPSCTGDPGVDSPVSALSLAWGALEAVEVKVGINIPIKEMLMSKMDKN
jgi:hypothetical protein